MTGEASVDFRVHPDQYRHWRLACAGPVATLTMDVDENAKLTGALDVFSVPTTLLLAGGRQAYREVGLDLAAIEARLR